MKNSNSTEGRRDNANGLAVAALIVALIALGFSIVAYNRAGTDIQDQAGQEAQEALVSARLGFARLQAATELTAIRTTEVTEENYETVESRVAGVRTRLGDAYRDAEREGTEEWRDLNSQFQQVENGLRARSADALAGLEGMINALREEVRTDDNG